jgi:hypothetical protein
MKHRALRRLILLPLACMSGCGITGPERCNPTSHTTTASGVVRDSVGTDLVRLNVGVQTVDGDSLAGTFFMRGDVPNGISPLHGHVRSAALVDQSGHTIYDVALDANNFAGVESTRRLRDSTLVASRRAGLKNDEFLISLMTDVPGLDALRIKLAFNPAQSGDSPRVCFRRGLLSD